MIYAGAVQLDWHSLISMERQIKSPFKKTQCLPRFVWQPLNLFHFFAKYELLHFIFYLLSLDSYSFKMIFPLENANLFLCSENCIIHAACNFQNFS